MNPVTDKVDASLAERLLPLREPELPGARPSAVALRRTAEARQRRTSFALAAGTTAVALAVTGGVIAATLNRPGATGIAGSPTATASAVTPTGSTASAAPPTPTPATATTPPTSASVTPSAPSGVVPGGPEQRCLVALPAAWQSAFAAPVVMPPVTAVGADGSAVAQVLQGTQGPNGPVDAKVSFFKPGAPGPSASTVLPGQRVLRAATDGRYVILGVYDSSLMAGGGAPIQRLLVWEPGVSEPTQIAFDPQVSKGTSFDGLVWLRDGVAYWTVLQTGTLHARDLRTGTTSSVADVYDVRWYDATTAYAGRSVSSPDLTRRITVRGAELTVVDAAAPAPRPSDAKVEGRRVSVYRDGVWKAVFEVPENLGNPSLESAADFLVLSDVNLRTYVVDARSGSYAALAPGARWEIRDGHVVLASYQGTQMALAPAPFSPISLPRLPQC